MFENSPGKPFILVGCKADLREDKNSNKDDCVQQDLFVSQSQVAQLKVLSQKAHSLAHYQGCGHICKSGGHEQTIFGHALYFSEDLLLPPSNYFLIDFKEIPSTILQKAVAPPHSHSTAHSIAGHSKRSKFNFPIFPYTNLAMSYREV